VITSQRRPISGPSVSNDVFKHHVTLNEAPSNGAQLCLSVFTEAELSVEGTRNNSRNSESVFASATLAASIAREALEFAPLGGAAIVKKIPPSSDSHATAVTSHANRHVRRRSHHVWSPVRPLMDTMAQKRQGTR